MKLNIVTYNIKFSSFIFEEEIERLGRKLDSDILCLQEFPLRKLDEWRRKLEKFGYRYHLYQKTCETLLGIHQSNVIFSKRELYGANSVDLTYKDLEPRKALSCFVSFGGQRLRLLHTHLGLRRGERLYQMRLLLDLLGDHQDPDPVALVGDFNDWNNAGHRHLFPFFQEAHQTLNGRSAKSFPAFFPMFRLDRIYYRNLQPLRCNLLNTEYLRKKSDHLALRASFQL